MTLIEKHTKAIERLKTKLFSRYTEADLGLYAEASLLPSFHEFPMPSREVLGGLQYYIQHKGSFYIRVTIQHAGGRMFTIWISKETGNYQNSFTMLASTMDVDDLASKLPEFIVEARNRAGVS